MAEKDIRSSRRNYGFDKLPKGQTRKELSKEEATIDSAPTGSSLIHGKPTSAKQSSFGKRIHFSETPQKVFSYSQAHFKGRHSDLRQRHVQQLGTVFQRQEMGLLVKQSQYHGRKSLTQERLHHGLIKGKEGQFKVPYIHRLSIQDLEELLHSPDPSEVILFIFNNLKAFQQSLDTCSTVRSIDYYIQLILNILQEICKAPTDLRENANLILAEFLSERCEKFHFQLSKYVHKMEFSSVEVHSIIQLFSELLRLFPDSWHVLPISDLLDNIGLFDDPQLTREIAGLEQMFKCNVAEHKKQKQKPQVDEFADWDNSQYRQMQCYPTIDEICTNYSPKLRSSIIKGGYTNWEHYYDIQFRLLREDFIAPLRNGMCQYRTETGQSDFNKKRHRNMDVNFYHNVRILEPVFTREGICYKVQFDASMFKLRNGWEHSKRLIFGSLLCFSPVSDKFKQIVYFAIVANRDPKELDKGIFLVQFQAGMEVSMLSECRRTEFIMAESKAYFEACRHILHSLQTAERDTMPFTRYLVLNQPQPVEKPMYLEDDKAIYDLRWLYSGKQWQPKMVNILKKDAWPSTEDIELDQSQLDAIQMALTQEIAVIQGPPGTGKTYIGIKIVQTLLQNIKKMGRHPILVMCYTNHALDQFLEGILDHSRGHPDIVRIGGRCQSERIQKFSINNMRTKVPWYLGSEKADLVKDIEELSKRIPWRSLQKSKQQPVNDFIIGPNGIQRLKRFMDPKHLNQLTSLAETDDHILEIWLDLWEDVLEDDVDCSKPKPLASKQNKHGLEAKTQAIAASENDTDKILSSEELVEIIGEATREEQARTIDENAFQPISIDDKEITEEVIFDQSFESHYQTPEIKHGKNAKKHKTKKLIRPLRRKSNEDVIKIIKQRRFTKPMKESEVKRIRNITVLSINDKWSLLRYWINLYQEHLTLTNSNMFERYTKSCQRLKEVQHEMDRYSLEEAEIIGMTTTGAAKYQHILHLVKPRIVIVEEAAEVLESHIVSSLNAGTQHLILIGDHKQLRPKPNDHNHAMKHNLHISLFERLLINNLPHTTLLIQHRMRPDIARLVCPHIYRNLVNHPCVEEYENVKGFAKESGEEQNIYFFNHNEPEEDDDLILSHSNDFEAKFVVALCRHLLNQNYKPTQITILTAYTGQLLKVRSKMPKDIFNGVRIVNVDNFQGEENDIIILSLVRSNAREEVGFLRESNRVCVALSRAKMGFYCFGNFTILRKKVPIWETIISDMETRGRVGNEFYIYCQNHRKTVFHVKSADEFKVFAPEGGCSKNCDYRLKCGHVCTRLCHNTDPDHERFQCKKPCIRLCKRNHSCPSVCFKDCPPCLVRETRILEPCGHEQELYCYEEKCTWLCNRLCDNELHHCQKLCHATTSCGPCKIKVEKKMPYCQHTQILPCSKDPHSHKCLKICQKQYPICYHYVDLECFKIPDHFDCSEPCKNKLECGHQCKKICGKTCSYISCTEKVQLTLDCGHIEEAECGKVWSSKDGKHIPYLESSFNPRYSIMFVSGIFSRRHLNPILCTNLCSRILACGHPCTNKCIDKCTVQCMVEVKEQWPCGHILKRKCFQSQDKERYPCTKPCTKELPCGHLCNKRCGDVCTDICDQLVRRDCPCGHTHKISCSTPVNQCPCREVCGKVLLCGHTCNGVCGQCYLTHLHQPCTENVQINRFCGHSVTTFCFGILDTCYKKGLAGCPHSSSYHCDKPPNNCKNVCNWKCRHFRCSQPCHSPCDRPLCNKACTKQLPCKHKCSGVCGEPCLKVCWHCNERKFKNKLGMGKRRIRFEANIFIQLDCEHIFTMKFLDQRFNQFKKGGLICPLQCPSCLKPVRMIGRYFNHIKERLELIRCISERLNSAVYMTESFLPEIKSDKEALYLVPAVEKNKNPEIIYSLKLFLIVKQLSQKVTAWCTKQTAKNFTQRVRHMIKTNHGKTSPQFIADIQRELLLLCMQEVIETTEPCIDEDVFSEDLTSFSTAKVALQRLKQDYQCDFTREECESYLSPLENLYFEVTNQTITGLIPSFPSPPQVTKGEWYKCPSGHIYFNSIYETKQLCCPECSAAK